MERVKLFITGDVIGVGFRSWVMEEAIKLKLSGMVENVYGKQEGVMVIAEGKTSDLNKFIEICQKGPEVAWVEKVDIQREKYQGSFIGFKIRK